MFLPDDALNDNEVEILKQLEAKLNKKELELLLKMIELSDKVVEEAHEVVEAAQVVARDAVENIEEYTDSLDALAADPAKPVPHKMVKGIAACIRKELTEFDAVFDIVY